MDPLIAVLVFIASLFLLVKGADWLIENASKLGRRYRISPIIIGLTVVAFGTSLPEFFVGIFAVITGTADISVGNVVGSNIANIGLVIGISALIFPLAIKEKTLLQEFPFLLISSFLLLILSNDNNIFGIDSFSIGRFDSIVFLLTLLFFLGYIYRSMKNSRAKESVEKEFKEEFGQSARHVLKDVALMVAGIAALVVGGRLIVAAASDIARSFGLTEAFIGATIVAVGTSIPELSASAMAAWKKQADIAVGNILGSNILNILFVLGVTGLIKPFTIAPSLVYFDMVVMTVITFMFLTFAITKRTIERHEAAILLLAYVMYIGYLVYLI
jgi:cation:H+ antiporter